MKYKDSYRHMKGGRDKYGNKVTNPNDWYERQERKLRKEENRRKRSFVEKMYHVDKHWVKTLSDEEMSDLYHSWERNNWIRREVAKAEDPSSLWFTGEEGDGSYENIKQFVEAKKPNYGSIREARELKIEDLFQD
jgi:hypothetical protein